MGVDSANGVMPQMPTPARIPNPPPLPGQPKDLLSHSAAARRVRRDTSWMARHVSNGNLRDYGHKENLRGGLPIRLVSLKEVLTLSDRLPRHTQTKRRAPPPPGKRVAIDTVTFAEAGAKLDVSPEWIRKLAKRGMLRVLGTQQGQGGPPSKVISLAEAKAALEKVASGRHGRPRTGRKAPPPPGKRVPVHKDVPLATQLAVSRKAKGVSQFIREEIHDFAQHIMVDTLGAASITIRANGQGGFDVVTVPAPATNTFTV